ncbi:MAG TPA: hypothetical protein VIF02_12815 [Methylocella sp.]
MNIIEALNDPHLFAPHFRGPSWVAWRAFLTAAFGLPMDDASRKLFRQCTGRAAIPAGPISEAALVVGRRGGKSRVLALIAVYLACFRDYAPYLAPGEVATIAVLAANRPQARSIFRYISGLLKAIPLFKPMVLDENQESIVLSNRVVIEVATASFRTSRGYSFAAVLADEVAFWRSDESSANPDIEIMRALRPGMASIPGSILMLASSPYAKRGELYAAFRRHFGKDDARVLVWKANTATMNPKIDPAIIAEAYDSDPEAARAEYGAEFRDDLADYITREAVDAVVCWGRSELPPEPGVKYAAFCDPSGGVNDAMTLAVAHLRDGAICVLDVVLEVRPPFDPEVAVSACTAVLRRFGVSRVIGDRYAGLWPAARFAEHGIAFEQSARPKSDVYCDLLPLLNAKRVELLDNPRLTAQLVGLERRTARSGRDTVDHTPGGHDDLANVVAGALVGLDLDRRPALVMQSDMLDAGRPVKVPDVGSIFMATMCLDMAGMCAAVRAVKTFDGQLVILDFEREPLHCSTLNGLTNFAQFACSCRNGILAIVPEGFAAGGSFNGCRAIEIIDGRLPELQLLSAAWMIDRGLVKLGPLAHEKAQCLPFGAALDFRAGENIEDPLRCAIMTTIAVAFEEDSRSLRVA